LEKEVCKKITEQATERINEILEQGINAENVEMLGELVDIQKDLEKIEYYKKKEEVLDYDVRKLWKLWKL
jgi:hypothetical protein